MRLVLLVLLAHKDLPVQMGKMEQQVLLDLVVQQEHPDHREHKDHRELLEIRDQQVHPDQPDLVG